MSDELWKKDPIGVWVRRDGLVFKPSYVDKCKHFHEEVYTYGYKTKNYLSVCYMQQQKYVHDMVCTLFICEKPSEEYECDHIDRNPTNNSVENLRWLTHKDNMGNAVIDYSKIDYKKIAKQNSKKVIRINANDENDIKSYSSVKEAVLDGFTESSISCCCNGKRNMKTHKGYIWKWADC